MCALYSEMILFGTWAPIGDIDPRKIGNLRLGVPVIGPDDLKDYSGCPLVSCVGSRGARSLIRERLKKSGYVEGHDYWCVL